MSVTKDSKDLDEQAMGNAAAIIERFGGIRPMATKMDVPVTTVQGWKKRNVIPGNRRDDVLRTARQNDLDLSDLLGNGKSIANENLGVTKASAKAKAPDQPFSASVRQAAAADTPQSAARHAQAVESGRNAPGVSHEALLEKLKQTETRAVKTSAWISGGLMVLVAAGALALLWPTKKQVEENGQKIAALDGEVKDVHKGFDLLKKMIPQDMQDRILHMQDQAAALESTVTDLGKRADVISRDVLGADAGSIERRLQVLERQVTEIAGPSSGLSDLMGRVREMQQSLDGQKQLSQSFAQLQSLVMGLQGQMEGLDAGLQQAQQQDGELGEALQGVSQDDLKAAAMLLAMAQFRQSLKRSEPFSEDLLVLKNLIGSDDAELSAAIDRLAPRASEGVLTPEGLKNEFKGLAGDIVVSSLKGEDVSVQEKAKARFNEILSVQKNGELLTGTDTQASVARAQAMLDAGDIEAAIAELQSLQGPAAQTAQPWVDQAEVTLMVNQLDKMLGQNILSKIRLPRGGASYIGGGLGAGLGSSLGAAGVGSLKSLEGVAKDYIQQQGHISSDEDSGVSIYRPGVKIELPDLKSSDLPLDR